MKTSVWFEKVPPNAEAGVQNGVFLQRRYLVKPVKAKVKLPTVLVVHENRGLNPHIEDIARRLALDNFIAFAPDALFPLGGYPGDEDKARELFSKLDQAKTKEDFVAAFGFLKKALGRQWQSWCGGFLLRWWHRQSSGDAPSRSECCSVFLWGTAIR